MCTPLSPPPPTSFGSCSIPSSGKFPGEALPSVDHLTAHLLVVNGRVALVTAGHGVTGSNWILGRNGLDIAVYAGCPKLATNNANLTAMDISCAGCVAPFVPGSSGVMYGDGAFALPLALVGVKLSSGGPCTGAGSRNLDAPWVCMLASCQQDCSAE
jgi:hypothetical protein